MACGFALLTTSSFVRPAAAASRLPELASDNVIEAVQSADQEMNTRKYRLALARLEGVLFPKGVRVGVELDSLGNSADTRLSVLRKSVSVWSDVLSGDSPIVFNVNATAPEVEIRFVGSIPKRGPDTLGLIDLERQYKWNSYKHFVHTNGSINIVTAHAGSSLLPSETQHVAMHELGHLLGLTDVVETGFLMGPMERGNPLPKPTAIEIQAVIQIRQAVRERIETIQRRLQSDRGVAATPAELAQVRNEYACHLADENPLSIAISRLRARSR